jgi:hypothetical protein
MMMMGQRGLPGGLPVNENTLNANAADDDEELSSEDDEESGDDNELNS